MAEKATKAKNKYKKKNYDQLNVVLPKGQGERLKKEARARGQSVSSMVQHLVTKKDGAGKKKK